MAVINEYIDEHMKVCELNSYIRDWLYMQPMCNDDGVTQKDLAKLKEVRRRLAEVFAFMEGCDDVVDTSRA